MGAELRPDVQSAPALGAPALGACHARLGGPIVFAHCVTAMPQIEAVCAAVPGLQAYAAERALAVAGADDVVLLAQPPDAAFLDLLAQWGLGPPRERIVVPAPPAGRSFAESALAVRARADAPALRRLGELLGPRVGVWVDALHAEAADQALAEGLGHAARTVAGDPSATYRADRKQLIRASAIELGVPVAPGTVIELAQGAGDRRADATALAAAIRRFARRTGRAIVRGSVGSSGTSLWVSGAAEAEVEKTVADILRREDNQVYLVDELLDVAVSPNVQTFIDPVDRCVTCIGITDQLLDQAGAHFGNVYPSCAETAPRLVEHALCLSQRLADQGLTGVIGFDFVEYADFGGRRRAVLAEINPRYNSASYPLALMERLTMRQRAFGRPEPAAFAAGRIATPARSFTELRTLLGGRLFDPRTGTGVVPFHAAAVGNGVVGVAVFARTREQAARDFAALAAGACQGRDSDGR
ncbi:MAG TPA: hypothetical protein VFW66_14205 [Gemmatimonadales bacterium]|nr:hypothetical protein [Gemmatimonadales bacterium]